MNALAVLCTLTLAAAPSAKGAKETPATAAADSRPRPARRADSMVGKEVRTVPLSEKQAARVHIVRTAPSYPATLEFPEPFAAAPACGDCGDKGLFRLDVFNDARYLTIKPRLFAGPQPDGSVVAAQDFLTVLTVRLASYTLTIQVEYTDEPTRADPRVVFTLPDRSAESTYVRTEIAKARKALEEEFASKVEQGVQQGFLQALTLPHACSRSGVRTRTDDLVVEIAEVCYFGANVYVRFTIENRGRVPADIADVVLRQGTGGSAAPLPDARTYFSQTHLEFQGSITGVVGAPLAEGEEPARAYELAVHERGGKNRKVLASGFGF